MSSKPILYHLLDENDLRREIAAKQDEFLDLYSLYIKTGIQSVKDELLMKAYELHVLNSNFVFHI